MKDNSIINSLKRLERVGSETSIVTKKLKKSAEEVAMKLQNLISDYIKQVYTDDFTPKKIVGKLYYFPIYNSNTCQFFWNFDGNLCLEFADDYKLVPDNGYINRLIALDFAKSISNGLLDDLSQWLEQKKLEAEKATKQLEKHIEE